MPYTQRHKQYLEAMGLVPWTLRGQSAVDVVAVGSSLTVTEASIEPVTEAPIESVNEPVPDPLLDPVIEDAGDCSVLLVFSGSPSHALEPLPEIENRLLLDMFGAIQLKDSSIARRAMLIDTAGDMSTALEPFLTDSVRVILIAVHDDDQLEGDEAASSRLTASGLSVPVWQLPHPAWIQQKPALKRRAWNVLKAAREKLRDDTPA